MSQHQNPPTLVAETLPPAPLSAERLTEIQALRDDVRRKAAGSLGKFSLQVAPDWYRLDCLLDESDELQRILEAETRRATSAEERATTPSPFQITGSDLYQNLQMEYFQMKQRAQAAEERATRAEAAADEMGEAVRRELHEVFGRLLWVGPSKDPVELQQQVRYELAQIVHGLGLPDLPTSHTYRADVVEGYHRFNPAAPLLGKIEAEELPAGSTPTSEKGAADNG